MCVFNKAKMLLPNGVDLKKWSVVACDQYTSEPGYWKMAEEETGNCPSSLKIIFPEIFLEHGDAEERIKNINKNMQKYIDEGILYETEPCIIYVERTLKNGKTRRGLMGAVDLEEYDFSKDSQSKIRATEGTVIERIPPRVAIRKNAPMEIPHIMLLIDDEKKEIIESLAPKKSEFEKIYDFELMADSGSIKGYKVSEGECENILKKLNVLDNKNDFEKKYGVCGKKVLTYAVGDGNHSLATAKTCYENLKKEVGKENAKLARYALVELVNLHDDSLEFEAIHRVLFGIDANKFISELKEKYDLENGESAASFEIVTERGSESFKIKNPDFNLTVGCIQSFIDAFLKENGGRVDYIHGDVARELGAQKGNLAVVLKPMKKNELFKTVILDGALPRKTFSMGEACDKRFYLEGRKIK